MEKIKNKLKEIKKKFDRNSISFKLWTYFILFAAFLMVLLWILQIVFLNTYYQDMKIAETKKIAREIEANYGKEDFFEEIMHMTMTNDLYIQIEMKDSILFSPLKSSDRAPTYMYMTEMRAVRNLLLENSRPYEPVSLMISGKERGGGDKKTLAYASYIGNPEDDIILYIFSPLFPVDSTVDILTKQLTQVTVISLLLSFALSFYLSKRITKTIKGITRSAEKLAKGEYGVVFEGTDYTEIKQLADTLNMTSKELQKTEELRKDLIANVSHDLKTPLTMVKSYAEMIRDLSGDNPQKRNAHLQVIIEEADRLNVLVNDMMDLSKLQTKVTELEKTKFDLCETAQETVHAFGIFESNEGYSFSLECPERPVMVMADENKIRRVMANLFNNAVKYCGTDKEIVIRILDEGDKARCEVSDHGMGISPEEIEQIWDRYYKASTHHVRATKGTGLGLSIVKEIIMLHEGSYGVESEEGKGSTFYFELDKCSDEE
ncbi:MAG: sensor histidine kinase [Anaerovoracaceae bacterium]